jgi:uncharacterized protein YhbP (UPF0306 family)
MEDWRWQVLAGLFVCATNTTVRYAHSLHRALNKVAGVLLIQSRFMTCMSQVQVESDHPKLQNAESHSQLVRVRASPA